VLVQIIISSPHSADPACHHCDNLFNDILIFPSVLFLLSGKTLCSVPTIVKAKILDLLSPVSCLISSSRQNLGFLHELGL
jgi:hypothetical protein